MSATPQHKRFGIIITSAGKSMLVQLPPNATQEQRDLAYMRFADHYVEVALVNKDEFGHVIAESITPVPEVHRINTLEYK